MATEDARQVAQWGLGRLSSVVASSCGRPSVLVDDILEALDEFTQGTEPYDDVTLVAVACGREALL